MLKGRADNIRQYLKRISMAEGKPTLEFLRQLQYQHVVTVPYENLDIINGKPISLKLEDIFEKIVVRHRGGYCFEINALFSWLLKELGFEVKDYLARFLRNEEKIPVRRHRVIGVTFGESQYFCDVGVGQGAPRYPLKMEEHLIQEQFGETYRFQKEEKLGWVLYDLHKGEWRKFLSFTEEEQYEVDFIQPSFYCETHPDSAFNKTTMVAIKTAAGRKTINDREYKEFSGENLIEIQKDMDDATRDEILQKEFGIVWRKNYD